MIDDPVPTPADTSRTAESETAGERPISDSRMVGMLWLVLIAAIIGLFPFTIYSTFLVPIAATACAPESGIGFLRGLAAWPRW